MTNRFLPGLVCLLSLTIAFAAGTAGPPQLKLPETVRPVHYAVDLTIVPGKTTFTGTADIEIDIREPQSLIWINATELNIHQVTLSTGGRTLTASVTPGDSNSVGLSFRSPVSGRGVLHLAWDGRISSKSSAGVFELTSAGQHYVYTQFEPTDARRAFPCFDQPSFKVPWLVTLHVPKEDKAFANYPESSQSDEADGMKVVHFAETAPLSSYLVAFAVGPFDVVDAGKVGKCPVRIITPMGRGGEAKYAAESVPQLLALLERYFGRPFPFAKLDSVVMPISNFAMENAGLITYGQSMLLAKPENDTLHRQRLCALVTAHEMAHQWFGDLVTTAWWNDIWLNEGFANWMDDKIVNEWKPEWNVDAEAVEERMRAMGLDSQLSARKIREPIDSENDIANAFDDITYDKGEAVLRMFESWIGPDTFRKGVQLYLNAHAYRAATTPEFEAAISEAAGKNIAPAFDSFLDQAGVPAVTATLHCGSGAATLSLSQKRSLPIGSQARGPQTWRLPICVAYQSGGTVQHQCDVISDRQAEITLQSASACPAWVLANDREAGYYRVNYQGDLLKNLLAAAPGFGAAEQTGIVGDIAAEVTTGDVAPRAALATVSQFRDNPHPQVIANDLKIAEYTVGPLVSDDLRPKGREFIRDNFAARAEALGWSAKPDDDDDTRLLRNELVTAVATNGEDRKLIDQAEKLANGWLTDRKGVDPDMLSDVLQVAARFGNRELFDRLHAAAREEKDPRVRSELIRALASFHDPEIEKSALQILLTGEFDIRQSLYPILREPLHYPGTRDLPFRFIREHLDQLMPRLPREVGEDFAAALPSVAAGFCDARERDEAKAFFADKVDSYSGGPRNLAHVLETVNTCIAERHVLGPEIDEFLRSYGGQ
jgi:alanyl aminopeptidase